MPESESLIYGLTLECNHIHLKKCITFGFRRRLSFQADLRLSSSVLCSNSGFQWLVAAALIGPLPVAGSKITFIALGLNCCTNCC